jgi:sugar phosphate isomerase/epimerase
MKLRLIALNRIKRIIEKAEQKNVNVAIENIRLTKYLQYILDNIHSDKLGFCFDSGHHNYHTPELDLLSIYGKKLMALHLHDNDGSGDHHMLPFDGNIDWCSTMKKISQQGYTGATSLELEGLGYEHLTNKPEEFLQIAFERAKKLDVLRKV